MPGAYPGGYAEGYGSVTTLAPFLAVEFDAGVWTDVTADAVAVATRRGRNRESGAYETGRLTLTLRNDARTYDPDHVTGPYYGKLRPNRRVRFQASIGATSGDVFLGYIDRITQQWGGPNDATAVIEASDLFKLLNRVELPGSGYIAEVKADAPSSWWRLDEPAGAVAAIDVINKVPATVNGTGLTFGASGLVVRDPGSSISGNGSQNSHLRVDDPSAMVTGANGFTIEVVFQGTAARGFWHQFGGGYFMNYQVQSDGNIEFTYFTSTGTLLLAMVSSHNLNDGAVHHVVVVYDGTGLYSYVDGVIDPSPITVVAPTPGLVFAPSPGARIFNGFVDAFAMTGSASNFAIYNRPLSAERIAAHAAAMRTPWRNDLPGPRLTRIFDLAGLPAADRAIDTGTTPLQSTDLGGTALAYAQKVEETEIGFLFVAANGKLTFVSRANGSAGAYLTSQGTLADADSGVTFPPAVPYRNASADVDESIIVTRATVSREGSVAVTVTDSAAQTEFGILDEVHDGLLHDSDTYSKYYAEWILNTHKSPSSRVGTVEVLPATDPANHWPLILGLELAERVTFKRKAQNTGAVVTTEMRIESISYEVAGLPSQWVVRLQLSPFYLAGGLQTGIWDTSLWDQSVWGI